MGLSCPLRASDVFKDQASSIPEIVLTLTCPSTRHLTLDNTGIPKLRRSSRKAIVRKGSQSWLQSLSRLMKQVPKGRKSPSSIITEFVDTVTN